LNSHCVSDAIRAAAVKFAYSAGWLDIVDPRIVDSYLTERRRIAHPSILKRVFDVAFSLVSLVLLFPLFLAIALAIKLTSKGPTLYSQTRVGYQGRPFTIYKFRTMAVNADQLLPKILDERQRAYDDGSPAMASFKFQVDPRITRVGRFLRRTSLDELPQFINVLLGDMSLVGPRPLPPWVYDSLHMHEVFAELTARWEIKRSSVRPGITGLWQITTSHHTIDYLVSLDLQYAEQFSVWSDMKILANTIPAAFREELNLDRKYINEQSLGLDFKLFAEYLESMFTRLIMSYTAEGHERS
jgi:lipopolysaccharide/colanic/teichoic acid biosynthesis glycosyltransferase